MLDGDADIAEFDDGEFLSYPKRTRAELRPRSMLRHRPMRLERLFLIALIMRKPSTIVSPAMAHTRAICRLVMGASIRLEPSRLPISARIMPTYSEPMKSSS